MSGELSAEVQSEIAIFRTKYSRPIAALFPPELFEISLRQLLKDQSSGYHHHFASKYFDIILEVVDDVYMTEEDSLRKHGKLVDWFTALDKPSLEITAREYLKQDWSCLVIEHLIIAAFIGHENSAFNLEMKPVMSARPGLLDGIIYGRRIAESRRVIAQMLEASRRIYDAVLSPFVSIPALRDLVLMAQKEKIYVNPFVLTIIDRCLGRGIKEFRRTI